MRFIKLISLILVLFMLVFSIGCDRNNDNPSSNAVSNSSENGNSDDNSSVESNPDVSSEPEKITDVDFSDLPDINTMSVRLYPSKETVLFEYLNPGMDSYESTLVNFSLREGKTLGRVDLGNGVFSVKTYDNGEFSVFDVMNLKGSFYSSDCQLTKTVEIKDFEGPAGFIMQGDRDDKILVSEMRSGDLYLVSSDGNEKSKMDLESGYYEAVGSADGRYVVTKDAQSVFVIEQGGVVRKIFSKGGITEVNNDYAIGRVGDYLLFLPLNQGDWMFKDIEDIEELPVAAGKGVFLTSALQGDNSVLRLYRLAKSEFAVKKIDGDIASAAITADGQIIAAFRSGEGFTYKFLDTADWDVKSFTTDNNISKFAESVELAELGNADKADEFARETLQKYNVRFVNEHCSFVDELGELGIYATMSTDRERLLHVEEHLVKSFAFLPDEVWQNIGGELPFVVFLCDEIPESNAGGLSFQFGGYNCIVIEIGGNDEYYTNLFMHETGHAISHCIMNSHPELIEEWLKLTPQYVLDAVEKGTLDGINALTVEFTPDDKSGNVCYVSAYAQKNPEEDRAETLAKFHDTVYVSNDKELFSHKVLKDKALMWGKMIRTTFDIGDEVVLPFDTLKTK